MTAKNKLITILEAKDDLSKRLEEVARTAETSFGRIGAAGAGALRGIAAAIANIPGWFKIALAAVGGMLFGLYKYFKWIFDQWRKLLDGIANHIKTIGHRLWQIGKGFFRAIIEEAGQAQAMALAVSMVARSSGIAAKTAQRMIEDLRETGISTVEAMQAVTRWYTMGLPLDKITQTARVAQDVAKAWGFVSTEVFGRFVEAMATMNMRLLREVGMMGHLTRVIKQYGGEVVGETIVGIDPRIVQMAMLNHILKEGAKYAGVYEEAQKNFIGQLKSMPRYIAEVKLALGTPFVVAFAPWVKAVNEFLKSLYKSKEICDGLLAPIKAVAAAIRAIGDALKTNFEDKLKRLADRWREWFSKERIVEIIDWIGRLGTKLLDLAQTLYPFLQMAVRYKVGEAYQRMAEWRVHAEEGFGVRAWLKAKAAGAAAFMEGMGAAGRTMQQMGMPFPAEFAETTERWKKDWSDLIERAKGGVPAAMKTVEEGNRLLKDTEKNTKDTAEAAQAMANAMKGAEFFGGGPRFERFARAYPYRAAGGRGVPSLGRLTIDISGASTQSEAARMTAEQICAHLGVGLAIGRT